MGRAPCLFRRFRRVLGVFVRREFAAFRVTFVQFGILLPLLGQVIQRKDRGDRADRYTGAAVDTLHWIDVKLRDLVEAGPAILVSRILLRVDTVYRAGIDAGSVFCFDAGFGDDEGRKPPPPICYPRYACPRGDASVAEVNSGLMVLGIEKISAVTFRVAICGTRAVLSGCSRHGARLRGRRCMFLFASSQRRPISDPQSGRGSSGKALGAAHLLRGGCGRALDLSQGKRI